MTESKATVPQIASVVNLLLDEEKVTGALDMSN
jgi:hypothetical protein